MDGKIKWGVDAPLVSVITPVYRGEKFVAQAVQSVLNQTYPNVEVIIVNDGSPDRSREILTPLLDSPKVRYVEQTNQGVAAARNAGLRMATGEFVALIDQDDLWFPEKLALQMEYFQRDAAVGLVHGEVTYIDEEGHPLPRDPFFPANVSGNCFPRIFVGNPVMTCSVLVRRSIVDRVGGFDEAIRFSDDYDLWLRVAAAGHDFAFVDRPIAMYRLHGANESKKTVEIIDYTIRVLEKTLQEVSNCIERVGSNCVRGRFANLYVRQASAYWARGNHLCAGVASLRALRYSPSATLAHFGRSRMASRLRWLGSKFSTRS